MLKIRLSVFSVLLMSLLFAQTHSAQNKGLPCDWTTWGYDQQRTGWNQGETILTKENVSRLSLLWNTRLSTPPSDVALSTLTAPLVVEGVTTPKGAKNLVFLLAADDTVYALDADTGEVFWQKTFRNPIPSARPATWLCPNTANDTPVIDKQRRVIFVITSDGKLHGLDLSDGTDRMAPADMVEPFTRVWSLNLIDEVVYTTSGRGCGQFPESIHAVEQAQVGSRNATRSTSDQATPSSVSAMNVRDLTHPQLTRFYTSSGKSSGPWGRGGVAAGPNGTVIAQTADGLYDPAAGSYGESVLELAPEARRLVDSFTPANWRTLNLQDLDLGSASPVTFPFLNRVLIAISSKEGFLYLLDAADLGGGLPNHSTPLYKSPQLGNDDAKGADPGQGVWGAITSYATTNGRRFLYVPMWGPPSKAAPQFKYRYGPTPHGSIMAFQVSAGAQLSLVPQWISPDMIVPDPPVVANGVVYAIQTGEQTIQLQRAIPGMPYLRNDDVLWAKFRATPVGNLTLFAFDAETGKQLYSSGKTIPNWVHFSEPVVALGKVFVVTHDAHVYAFGLKSESRH